MVSPFKQPAKSLKKINKYNLITQLRLGYRCNACGTRLTRNGKNDPYKILKQKGTRKRVIKIRDSRLFRKLDDKQIFIFYMLSVNSWLIRITKCRIKMVKSYWDWNSPDGVPGVGRVHSGGGARPDLCSVLLSLFSKNFNPYLPVVFWP